MEDLSFLILSLFFLALLVSIVRQRRAHRASGAGVGGGALRPLSSDSAARGCR